MFVSGIIENKKYFKYLRYLHIFNLVPSFLIIFFVYIFINKASWIFYILVAILFITEIYFRGKIQKKIQEKLLEYISKRKIKIENDKIRIEFRNGDIEQDFDVGLLKKIIVQEDYSLKKDNFKTLINQFKGKFKKYYIILDTGSGVEKYQFGIASHYMAIEIQNIIEHWKIKGINVEVKKSLDSLFQNEN